MDSILSLYYASVAAVGLPLTVLLSLVSVGAIAGLAFGLLAAGFNFVIFLLVVVGKLFVAALVVFVCIAMLTPLV